MDRINILGAGPAGMYLAAILKKNNHKSEICLFDKASREEAKEGIGYVFTEEMFSFFRHFGSENQLSLEMGNPIWNIDSIIPKSGKEIFRIPRFNNRGITRNKLMTHLEKIVLDFDIPIHYNNEITKYNFEQYKDVDLVIVSTGSKRFMSPEQAKKFKVYEAEVPLQYCWLLQNNSLPCYTLKIGKAGNIPFIMNSYPISDYQSASVVEVLSKDADEFIDNSNHFTDVVNTVYLKQEKFYASKNPKSGNVILLGEAACTPYFCTGVGLQTAFTIGEGILEAITSYIGTVEDRLKLSSFVQGRLYLNYLKTSIKMAENKIKVLENFDSLSESDQVLLLTGRKID